MTPSLLLVALALVAGAASQFAVGRASPTDGPALVVNGEPVSGLEIERLKTSNPILGLGPGGVIGQDVSNLLVDQAVLLSAVKQDSSGVEVSDAAVEKFIADLRQQQNLQDEADYLSRIGQFGYTDATFRTAVREQLKLQKRIEEVQKRAVVTPEEARFYLELHHED